MRLSILFLVILLGSSTVEVGAEPTKRLEAPEKAVSVSDDPNDWPMYNRDGIGTRYNPGEKALSKDNVAKLVEKWRFPAADSQEKIGVVHATVAVNGYVYFGTGKPATFYKLTPNGEMKWKFKGKVRPPVPFSLSACRGRDSSTLRWSRTTPFTSEISAG